MATKQAPAQKVIRYESLSDFARSFDHVQWSPPTADDVSRMKLDSPPATKAQIATAFEQPIRGGGQ